MVNARLCKETGLALAWEILTFLLWVYMTSKCFDYASARCSDVPSKKKNKQTNQTF